MAKTTAYQLQKTDIRVNTICPGLIETGMMRETFEYARQRGTAGKLGQLNPLARFGVAEGTSSVYNNQIMCLSKRNVEIAQVAVFLASGESTINSSY
jgi:NAD(P)-dependent dehydrogenase (short-subunit alcohol dehydrogenase family)